MTRKPKVQIVPRGPRPAAKGFNSPEELDAKTQRRLAMETERFFAERGERADDAAFLRILNREGGEPPRPEDTIE
jgi:hypothetical protein